MYSLRRESDGEGDSGNMSLLLWGDENNELHKEHSGRPRVGVAIRVGSIYARTFETFDYWTTTYIKEILEERDDYVKFRTNNSVYEWRKI